MKQKLLLLLTLLVCMVSGAWADTLLKTIDFSKAEWSGVTFTQGASDDPETKNGVTFNAKSGTYHFSIADGKLTFPNTSPSLGNYFLGFPVTGIVGGTVVVKIYNGDTSTRIKYTVKDGGTAYSTSDCGSGTNGSSGSPCTITKTGLTETNAYIYIGRYSNSYTNITKIEVSTYETADLSVSSFYPFYKESSSSVTPASLISDASLPSYVNMDITIADNSTDNISDVKTPHNFSTLNSTKYYRLKPSKSSKIVIGGLSNVKSIRLYGNGSSYAGNITTTVTKLSGDGSAFTVDNVAFENSQTTIKEYSTGDLTQKTDYYDKDTYYLYTITITGDGYTGYFSLWGLYIEAADLTPAVEAYTVTFNAGSHGTCDTSSLSEENPGDGVTLPSISANTGYTFDGWYTSNGTKVGDASETYYPSSDITSYAHYSAKTYTITLDDNGGTADGDATATYDSNTLSSLSVPTYSGHCVSGYYKEKELTNLIADAEGNLKINTDYTDASGNWICDDNMTFYTKWAENYCELVPNTSGTAPSSGATINMQSGYGGAMTANTANLSYTDNGLLFGYGGDPGATVVLNDYLQVGSIISVTIYADGSGTRGLHLYTNAATPSKVTSLNIESATLGDVKTIQYKVVAEDGLEGTNSFQLRRNSNVSLKSLTVTDCQPGGVITASGWSTYSSNKKLDLSTISGGTAYVAVADEGTRVRMKPCTDIVAAETGLMIKGTANATFTINTTTSAATLSMDNLMEGLPNGGTVAYDDGNYVFGWPTASETPANDCGFYYVNSSAAKLGIGKAYLHVESASSARLSLFIDDDDTTTGIDDTLNGQTANGKLVYDLQGRKVAKPKKGLYIKDGRKVVIK